MFLVLQCSMLKIAQLKGFLLLAIVQAPKFKNKNHLGLKNLGAMTWSVEILFEFNTLKFNVERWNVVTNISFDTPKFNAKVWSTES